MIAGSCVKSMLCKKLSDYLPNSTIFLSTMNENSCCFLPWPAFGVVGNWPPNYNFVSSSFSFTKYSNHTLVPEHVMYFHSLLSFSLSVLSMEVFYILFFLYIWEFFICYAKTIYTLNYFLISAVIWLLLGLSLGSVYFGTWL